MSDGRGGVGHGRSAAASPLFDRPIVSVGEVRALTGTSSAAANQLVARMTELGILREVTGHTRNRRFRYEPYVRLFTEDAEESADGESAAL